MITYPRYADFADESKTNGNKTVQPGKNFIITKSILLKRVIVHNTGAIRIKVIPPNLLPTVLK
jgi:hypothetical protein